MIFAFVRWMRTSGIGSQMHSITGAVHASPFERIQKSAPSLRPKTRTDMIPVGIGWKIDSLV